MDIAVPEKKDASEKIAVAVSSDIQPEKPEVSTTPVADKPTETLETEKQSTAEPIAEKLAPKADLKDEEFAKEEADRKNLAELITSKKYFLPIHEKRTKPLLTLALLPKRSKKPKKKVTKNIESTKKTKPKSKQALLIVVLVVVLIGSVIAIDAGVIDIGVKLPFDLIKNV